MKNFFKISLPIATVLVLSTSIFAQQTKRTPFDVTGYVMDVQLSPVENKLAATVDVTFVPKEDTRTVAFELNGSLKVDEVNRVGISTPMPAATGKGRTARPVAVTPSVGGVTFVQDQAGGSSDLGPHVRVDLGSDITKGTPVTLRFKYSGVLNLPSGGPLLNKRLAYVGENQGYLMYAARWFPFHDYAADPATADISISVPGGYQVIGYSDAPASNAGGKFRFVQSTPALVGNLAYGKYTTRTLNIGGYELQFFTKPGSDQQVIGYGETLGKALEFYTKKYGEPAMGKRLIVVQIDDESLDLYSSQGMLFIADRQFEQAREITNERLQREAAYQWWGLTVGLKSFDDAWLAQGLSEYSAFAFRESTATGAQLDNLRRELLEKSLTFEQTASLLRAPANLDDQSTAYQYIMYAKGAFVFKLLRDTLGEQKFNQLLRTHLQENRGKNISIDEFEKLASRIGGDPLRYFFARWVEGTGVPEFTSDYLIIRTRGGKFVARGTVKQNYDNLRLPVEVQLRSEGENGLHTQVLQMDEASADFNIESTGKPLSVVIDPNYKLLRISPDLRVSSIARRGIERFKEGSYAEAQAQFEEALKLDRSNSWIYYHLGLLFLEQRNYDLAVDNFKAALGGNISPTWLSVWSNIKMGNAYDAKGDRNRAVSAYKRAADLGDNYDNAQEAVKRYQSAPYDPKEKQATASR
ncbi:MAG: tetratricopeptide repeat protein [Blastocatellia bacterium]|nr:tetratricopeptide repeat protein [Blastocatellia bacterium]